MLLVLWEVILGLVFGAAAAPAHYTIYNIKFYVLYHSEHIPTMVHGLSKLTTTVLQASRFPYRTFRAPLIYRVAK